MSSTILDTLSKKKNSINFYFRRVFTIDDSSWKIRPIPVISLPRLFLLSILCRYHYSYSSFSRYLDRNYHVEWQDWTPPYCCHHHLLHYHILRPILPHYSWFLAMGGIYVSLFYSRWCMHCLTPHIGSTWPCRRWSRWIWMEAGSNIQTFVHHHHPVQQGQ